MKFNLDEQTFRDLGIFETYQGERSIIGMFKPISLQGKETLKRIFKTPSTSLKVIEDRLSSIQYIEKYGLGFDIDKSDLDFIEHYISRGNKPTEISNYRALEKGIWNYLKPSNAYYIIRRGVYDTLFQLDAIYTWAQEMQKNSLPTQLNIYVNTILSTIEHEDFAITKQLKGKKKLSIVNTHRCDYLFRYLGYDRLLKILGVIYQLDVFQAAVLTKKEYKLTYPKFTNHPKTEIKIKGVFHPLLTKPITNDFYLHSDKNICFLTGSNMAGKSTLLKSIGLSVYLAHLGFPVPSCEMETSLMNGLITTINLSDDIISGHSHFYSEVLRVKEVAQSINKYHNMLVIFDELFRGTNVKDAFDASKAVIEAFSTVKTSLFIVSTHIVEVAKELETLKSIDFKYLETSFLNNKPKFNYKLKNGITEERVAMWVINSERVIETIMMHQNGNECKRALEGG